MTESDRPKHGVVVVGDSLVDAGGDVSPPLRQYAAVIEDLAGLPAHVLRLGAGDPQQLQAVLPADVGVVVLTHARPEYVRAAQAAVDVPVLTDQDTGAIVLAARLLTTLTRAGRAPRSSRVVIAGADTIPTLCPLAMAAGVGDITTWHQEDSVAFPLRRIASGVDAVIDLLGAWPPADADAMHAEPAVIVPENRRDPLLALPGLLRALTRTPGARLDVDVQHACVLALVMATPPDQQLPHGPDRTLADQVADAATQALRQQAQRRHDSTSIRPAP